MEALVTPALGSSPSPSPVSSPRSQAPGACRVSKPFVSVTVGNSASGFLVQGSRLTFFVQRRGPRWCVRCVSRQGRAAACVADSLSLCSVADSNPALPSRTALARQLQGLARREAPHCCSLSLSRLPLPRFPVSGRRCAVLVGIFKYASLDNLRRPAVTAASHTRLTSLPPAACVLRSAFS